MNNVSIQIKNRTDFFCIKIDFGMYILIKIVLIILIID
jgi:hypothetical protein